MTIVLGDNQYGKAETHVVRVTKSGVRHEIKDLTVSVTLAGDFAIDATKIGMLATSAIVEAVAAAIAELELPLVVLDPVLVSSSGERLLDTDGVQALCTGLIPLVRVVTPNIPEAEALSGKRIMSLDDARTAARRIHDMGADAVIITGGHLEKPVDVCCDADGFECFLTGTIS